MNRLFASPYAAPALLLAFVALVMFALGIYTRQLAESGRIAAEQQGAALAAARARYEGAGGERELLTRYSPEYRALADLGFVGAERRANWIDALRVASDATGLPGVQYQIGAQAPLTMPGVAPSTLTQSSMKIDLRLLHEGDLMRFLRALAAERAGVFRVNECSLERAASLLAGSSIQNSLRAECDLAWISAPAPGGGVR